MWRGTSLKVWKYMASLGILGNEDVFQHVVVSGFKIYRSTATSLKNRKVDPFLQSISSRTWRKPKPQIDPCPLQNLCPGTFAWDGLTFRRLPLSSRTTWYASTTVDIVISLRPSSNNFWTSSRSLRTPSLRSMEPLSPKPFWKKTFGGSKLDSFNGTTSSETLIRQQHQKTRRPSNSKPTARQQETRPN